MRRSHFLRFTCILMMLTSLIRFIMGLTMFNFYVSARNMGGFDDKTIRYAAITLGVLTLCALAELISGFIGSLNWDEPLLAYRCVRWGIISLGLGLAGNLLQGLLGYGVSYVAWTTGAVIPALYAAAALRFQRKSRK